MLENALIDKICLRNVFILLKNDDIRGSTNN